jgi:hypothetical protein
VTSDGVISNVGKVYYLPMTKYTVIKEQSVESVVTAVLKAFRESILSGHRSSHMEDTPKQKKQRHDSR